METLTVFGATGQTGQQIVTQGIERGFQIRAFVRNAAKMSPQAQLEIIQGDLLDQEDLQKAIRDSRAVLIALGADPSDKSMIRARATEAIIQAMDATGVGRLICMTSLGVGDSREIMAQPMRTFLLDLVLKNAINDHNAQEEYIMKSDTLWTIARPARLTDGPLTGKYQVDVQKGDNYTSQISRADVADFMLSAVDSDEYLKQSVVLSY